MKGVAEGVTIFERDVEDGGARLELVVVEAGDAVLRASNLCINTGDGG